MQNFKYSNFNLLYIVNKAITKNKGIELNIILDKNYAMNRLNIIYVYRI